MADNTWRICEQKEERVQYNSLLKLLSKYKKQKQKGGLQNKKHLP